MYKQTASGLDILSITFDGRPLSTRAFAANGTSSKSFRGSKALNVATAGASVEDTDTLGGWWGWSPT